MDDFERFLINRINDFDNRLKENEGNTESCYLLNNLIEELLEVLSNYNLKYKF